MEFAMSKDETVKSPALLRVVKSLTSSGENKSERDLEKKRLEYEFNEQDQILNKLVEERHVSLNSTLQSFTGIASRIKDSRDKVKNLKETLNNCKNLLHCKRDDLRKHWIESMELNDVLFLLDKIDKARNVPEELQKYTESKYYLHATKLLVQTVEVLDKNLKGVEALRELRVDLQTRKERMHERLLEELNRHLYLESSKTTQLKSLGLKGAFSPKRDDKDQSILSVESIPVSESPGGEFKRTHRITASRNQIMEETLAAENSEDKEELINEDLHINPESDSAHFMTILVQCLALLEKVPEATEELKNCMKREMTGIVHRATTEVKERIGNREEMKSKLNVLLKLLEVIFEKFKGVARAHEVVLKALQRVTAEQEAKTMAVEELSESTDDSDEEDDSETETNETSSPKETNETTSPKESKEVAESTKLYTMEDVWSEIQFTIQVLLSDYLDIQNVQSPHHPTPASFSESDMDISSFFSLKKKGAAPPRKIPLFRFEGSSSSLSMNTYIREKRQEAASPFSMSEEDPYGSQMYKTRPELLCPPSMKNITVIFRPVMKFVVTVESSINYEPKMRCILYQFITDYVKDVYVGEKQYEINQQIDSVTKGNDGFKTLVSASVTKKLEADRPLLKSTVLVEEMIQDLKGLMQSLPLYASKFMEMICAILNNYKETCYAAYKTIVKVTQSNSVSPIISATWAKDDDISRLLRSLPNWTNLHGHTKHRKKEIEENSEAIRMRNERESELLINNLGETVIKKNEVILNSADLKTLANLQESTEWLTGRIKSFASSLSAETTGINVLSPGSHEKLKVQDIPPISEDMLRILNNLGQDFQNLAEMCLLVLHLEIRCHCFYYLLQALRQTSYVCSVESVDADTLVIQMNKDLIALEDIVATSLAPHKFKYMFEGLGHMMSSLIISAAPNIKKINSNGVKKMSRNIFAIQQNLLNITQSREPDLDKARLYYDLLYKIPGDFLVVLVEQGAKYTDIEYENILNLYARSQAVIDKEANKQRLAKLKEILKELRINQQTTV
ncbi:Exocyst complex component 4 [Paramuricea clavata]|uniref:Exocyst complex component Sec8 n=1 Tax=Paramuricea clavata TaxID=317549 RepID=A0A7D9HA14_PARCT|nr:Exocyst complex component 4 [Paramuricea clavata]